MLTLLFAPGAGSIAVQIALHGIGTVFEAGPLFLPTAAQPVRLAAACWSVVDGR